jgi:hypothetical protein
MPNLIVKITATEIIIPYEGLNFKYLEEKIMEVLKGTGKRVLEASIKAVDEMENRERAGGLKIKGLGSKYLETVFGTIQYKRRRYYDAGKKGSRYLADEKLGIRKGAETSPVKDMLDGELAVLSGSYRNASELAKKYFISSRSHESIRQVVVREGKAMKAHQESEIEKIRVEAYTGGIVEGGNTPEVAYIEVDGTGLKIQKRRGLKRSRSRNREVKLGIVYSGHERRYAGGNGKQKKLKDKHVYASMEKADRFMEKFSLICEKVLKISKAKLKLLGGDGAEWIKEGKDNYFWDAKYVLCKFHQHRAIKKALGYNRELEKKLKDYLNLDKLDEGIRFIDKIISNTGTEEKDQLNKLKDLREYIANNREGINAIRRIKADLSKEDKRMMMNTGAIESNIYNVVTQRMKKRRMSWSESGAESMLQLICRMMNEGGLDNWYRKDRQERIEITERDYRRLVANTVWSDRSSGYPLSAKLPALEGPCQDKIWVEVLRNMKDGDPVSSYGADVEVSALEPKAEIN